MKVYIGRYPKKADKERKVSVRIDKWDSYNADQTLAIIIVPLLKQLQATKHGAPCVDDADVPEGLGLRSTECKPKERAWDVDENHFKRWDWVLSEIIWVMNEIANGKPGEDQFYDHSDVDESADLGVQIGQIKLDMQGLEAYNQRLQKGCELFGRYYMNLWD